MSFLFRSKPRVVIICTANICRSPVAAAMLRNELKALGAQRLCQVRSAGTRVAGPGQPPDPRMKKLAQAAGISLRGERATPLDHELAASAALIVAMERRHLEYAASLLVDVQNPPALRLLGEWLPDEAGVNPEIDDPYFASSEAIEGAFVQLGRASRGLARALVERRVSLN